MGVPGRRPPLHEHAAIDQPGDMHDESFDQTFPFDFGGTPLCGDLVDLGPVAIGQKCPSVTLGLEIAQALIGQANCFAVPLDIEFAVRRTTDLESVGTLVAHLISPIRFRRSCFIRQ